MESQDATGSLKETLSIEEVLHKPIMDFLEWTEEQFSFETPPCIESDEDAHRGLEMLRLYAGFTDYLKSLSSYAKVFARDYKRKGAEYKIQYEDMVDREKIIDNRLDAIKISYQALNKWITVYTEEQRASRDFTRR